VTLAPEPSFVHRFAPHVAELPIARAALRDWLASEPRDPDACQELLVVATELCTNAVRHSGSGLVTLRAWAEGDAVVVEVEGMDNPREVSTIVRRPDDPYEEGGRGMVIVQTLCDDLSIMVRGRHRLVRCRKMLADA